MSLEAQQQFQQPQQGEIAAPQSDTLWEFADIGFDTQKKLWFLQLFDSVNANVGFYTAKTVIMTGGFASQYQWKDQQGRPFWHVRERFLASEVEGFQIDMKGNLVINFARKEGETEGSSHRVVGDEVPKNFAYLQYAYHLTTKETAQSNDLAPMGFIEFCNEKGEIVGRLNNRWIIVEDVRRRTAGEFPKVRLRIESKDIGRITASRSAIIIEGKRD